MNFESSSGLTMSTMAEKFGQQEIVSRLAGIEMGVGLQAGVFVIQGLVDTLNKSGENGECRIM